MALHTSEQVIQRLSINVNENPNTSYQFYVNGTSYHGNSDTHAGDIIPTTNNTYNFGISDKYWQKGYITKIYNDEIITKDEHLKLLHISGTITTTANTWYRIAESDSLAVADTTGTFEIRNINASNPLALKLEAGLMYHSQPFIILLYNSDWDTTKFTKARITYKQNYGSQKAYLEILYRSAQDWQYDLKFSGRGWLLCTPTATTEELTENLNKSYVINLEYNAIVANKFNGAATKLGTTTIGGNYQPIYLNEGVPTATNYFVNNQKLNNSINLNTIQITGRYCTNYNHRITNLPNNDSMEWGVDVIATRYVATNDSYSWQMAYPAYKADATNNKINKIYVRLTQNNSYTNWHKLVIEDGTSYNININGNAATATKLIATKNINGTAFDGSTDITTANWGTSRNITIGITTKSINGSDNVSWSLNEIGGSMHLTSYNFNTTLPLSRYCTFDVNLPEGGPGSWINGWISAHNNYLASYIVNKHRTDDWYLGWNQYNTNNGTISTVPTWRKILHDTNYTDYTVKKDGTGASGSWSISITGNANTATTLQTARNINGTSFNGSADITTTNWGTARNISIADADSSNTGTAVSVNGSAAVTLKLPATIKATLKGNADTTSKLVTKRNIAISGAVSGNADFDGSENITITTTEVLTNCNLTTIQKTLTITNEWQDTGIKGADLATGTYIILMSGFNNGYIGQWGEIYSGVLTWYDGGTNSTEYDDIILHKAGHASNSHAIFLRTIRSGRTAEIPYLRLLIKGSATATAETTVYFKFRRMI